MCVMMNFPKTVDEFMEMYKIVDTDKVYTNGTELVPIFRMKQWFEHAQCIDIVRCGECKYRDTGGCVFYCANWYAHDDDYCPYGERRADDET